MQTGSTVTQTSTQTTHVVMNTWKFEGSSYSSWSSVGIGGTEIVGGGDRMEGGSEPGNKH